MSQDSLKVAIEKTDKLILTDYQPALELLKILIWPIIVIIIVLILKKTIINLLNRISKIGFAGVGAEVSQQKQENVENGLPEHGKKIENTNENIEKTLGLFSQLTINKAISVVNDESKVNEIKVDAEKIETLHKYSQALYLILSFERIYNVIFGSQLYILERINTTNNETKDSLKRYYENAQKKENEFYSTYSYDDYFNFLVNNDLLLINESETCSITFLGRDFLKYLVENGKTLNRKY